MFPKINRVRTRVFTTSDTKPVVQFYDTAEGLWGEEITLKFDRAGIAVFSLDMDLVEEKYIFLGALQKSAGHSHPDTHWNFEVNCAGNILTLNNDCKHKQNIDIKLSLIPRDDDNPLDQVVSADPVIRNEPD